jgi:hypothetical protein
MRPVQFEVTDMPSQSVVKTSFSKFPNTVHGYPSAVGFPDSKATLHLMCDRGDTLQNPNMCNHGVNLFDNDRLHYSSMGIPILGRVFKEW